jgi:hypothetical protein
MRTMLNIQMPVEKSNQAIQSGHLPKGLEAIKTATAAV